MEFGVECMVSLHMDLASCARVLGLIGCTNLDCRVSGSGFFVLVFRAFAFRLRVLGSIDFAGMSS